MTVRTFAVILVLSLALGACGGGGSSGSGGGRNDIATVETNAPPLNPPTGGGGSQDPVDENRARWNAAGIANYDFTLQRTAFTIPLYVEPVTLQVRAGQVISRTFANTGLPVAPQDANWWPHIDGLFDIIEAARDQPADVLTVTWDPQYGYPTFADIDGDTGLGDDEHSFRVTGFVVR